jgi:Mn-containing catalase
MSNRCIGFPVRHDTCSATHGPNDDAASRHPGEQRRTFVFHHVKKLMYTVRVDAPDPRFGNMLLIDIGVEEMSHLEVIGMLAKMHLKPTKDDAKLARADPLTAVAGGGGVNLFNSQGNPWTADYLKITGELDVDLRSNIAAEARAKIVYERLIDFCDDRGTKDALQFLMTREITHMKAFTAALESLGKDRFSIGAIPPSPDVVNKYVDDSTGTGELGEEATGPWNTGDGWEIVKAPALHAMAGK